MKKKILFIEDERALHQALKEILKDEDYEIISAFDGEEGLKKLKETKPDLILLDLILPRIHGFDVLREIKNNSETKDIPLIILTNLEELEDIEKALELGATTYLAKSTHGLTEVVNKIKEVLEG
jgi:DNA-binding response OmpR family regulator